MTSAERPVFDAFREHLDLLRALLESDERVRDLCDDFDAVHIAYQRSVEADDEHAAVLADEYHALRVELETELLELLHQEAL